MEQRRAIAHRGQLALDLAPSPPHELTPRERREAITLLAQLLLEARGLAQWESDDERI